MKIEWRKSNRSQGGAECIELAVNLPSSTAIRDSKNPSGPRIALDHRSLAELFSQIKRGRISL